MIINHNMNAMNAHRLMTGNTSNAGKSMEKLSSGLRINRAGDDAAGLAISEKMRAQVRGLDQASRNSQDGISMIQTAEGALNETHSILQRMRELATQAGNDTNVSVDRGEIQKEMNQLSSEINRIGNTTEFNTKALLKGDGTQNLQKTGAVSADAVLAGGTTVNTQASQLITIAAAATAGSTLKVTLNGQEINLSFAANAVTANDGKLVDTKTTGNSAEIYIDSTSANATSDATSIAAALNTVIGQNSALKGGFTASADATGHITIAATATGQFAGSAGNIAAATASSTTFVAAAGVASVGTTTYTPASATVTLTATAAATDLIGKGMMVGDHEIEFYDASKGAYTGSNVGVDISGTTDGTSVAAKIVTQLGTKFDDITITNTNNVLTFTSKAQGAAGNGVKVTDGGVQKAFEATLQVGANKGQGFKIDINDMRAEALSVTGVAGKDATEGAKFTTSNTVTNGTDSTTREAALDVSSYENATAAVKVINNAIEKVSAERSKLGAFQNRLEHTIANLGTSSENLTAAESRVRDVDMAKEMMQFSKNNILSQASQAMLAQAKSQPEAVLQLLR